MKIDQAMQTALDFEQKGKKIYLETAEKTKNPIVKKTFQYLADQEQHHIENIHDYMEKHIIGLKGETSEDAEKLFTTTVREFKEKTELSDGDKNAHETALELEKKSYDFYKEQHDSTDDEKLKKFFKFLMDQENTHYELIEKAYYYISNPAMWDAEEEKWMPEGG